MEENQDEKIIEAYGSRAQRCFGCLIAYRMKDMYLGEDVTYYCDHCKDDSMFHFDDFSKLLDTEKLRDI